MIQRIAADPDVVPFPREFVERYRSVGAWHDLTIAQEFQAVADRFPDRPAVVGPDGALTYRELDGKADRIAVGLRNLGLVPGDRVLFQVTNSAAAILIWYGVLKAGAVPVATLALHRRHEILAIARQCEPVAHVIEPAFARHDLRELAGEVRHELPSLRLLVTVGDDAPGPGETTLQSLVDTEVEPVAAREIVDGIQRGLPSEGLGVLQLSGGTTSVPKLIPRLHTEYWYNARAWAEVTGMDSGTCVAHLLPIVHNADIACAVHAAHAVGGLRGDLHARQCQFKVIAQARPITHVLMMRPILQMIESEPELRELLRNLQAVAWGDRAVPLSAIEEYQSESCRIAGMFGMGEGLCIFTTADAPVELAHGTQGTPITPYDEIRVLEPGLEDPVEVGERGELCVRGPYTIRGYFRAPERNAEAFTADGFYRTGDIVREIRREGRSYYRLEDRIKDLINRGARRSTPKRWNWC